MKLLVLYPFLFGKELNVDFWLWFSNVKTLEYGEKKKLLDVLKEPEKIYKADKKTLLNVDGITEKTASIMAKNKDLELVDRMQKYMKQNKIYQVNICDKDYPLALRDIPNPPITLFYKGDISLANDNCLGVIGSRRPTCYGRDMAFKIGKDLGKRGYTIVSGMAYGIDSEAHRGALFVDGKTIAVVGSGLDTVYPIEHTNLCKKIAENGLVLSEYAVGTRSNPTHYPARNRIISGLSRNLIVVEASLRSGTLITVDFALEQGKNVFAVPGNIDSEMSLGTNELIKNGAFIYTSPKDLF